jgi:spermidine synthase
MSESSSDFWISDYITPWDIYIHGITKVLMYKKTAYQEMYIVETGTYGKALVLDGKWQSATGDEFLYHEPLVHPGMVSHGSPRKVLVLGGGEGATTREILRWKTVEKVVMIDIDREVVEACKEYLPEMHQGSFNDPRCEVVIGDALDYLDKTGNDWDIVISDLSDPIEDGPSFQLFTKEYFEKVRAIMSQNGFFVVQAGPVSPGELQLHVRIINTLKAVFPHVYSYTSYIPTYGTPWGFAIASTQAINTRREPSEVDIILTEKTTGGFQMFDGITLLGLWQLPRHLRHAIASETEVYTMAKPPKFFRKGSVS